MLVIDTHAHIVSPDRARYPLTPYEGRLGEWVNEHPVYAEDLLAEMDSAGVDRAVLVQSAYAYAYENAYVADSAREHPARFVSVCIIDMLAPDAVETLTRLVKDRGIRGVRLFTTPEPEAPWLDDPRTFPVWQTACELGIPVVVQLFTRHLPRLYKVVEKHPDVLVALDHLASAQLEAGNIPPADLVAFGQLPNVYLKLSTVNLYDVEKKGVPVAEYFGPLLDAFGAQRLMWGSNYPNTYDRPYAEMLLLARDAFSYLSDADQEWLFGNTTLHLWPDLGVNHPHVHRS